MNEPGGFGLRKAGLITLLLSPFGFGAVPSEIWVPLAWLWAFIGGAAAVRNRGELRSEATSALPARVTFLLVVLHCIFALQLVPLPPDVLRVLSPGSYAAHYIPPPAQIHWAPIAVSRNGTQQAWLFFAGLHGLAYALFRTPGSASRKTVLFFGMSGVGMILAVEGLVQAASPNPYWLYGVFAVPGASVHESGIFGPYYNRDHYSNLLAISGSVSAGLLALRLSSIRAGSRSILGSRHFSAVVALAVALTVILAASAASGSRGGLLALGAGLTVGLSSLLRARPRLALIGATAMALVLFGTGVPSAVERMGDVDFEASRLMVWRDALRLTEFFPLFGCGLGGFGACYWPYQRVVRFEYWPHAHNEFLQWWIETGAVGLLVGLGCARLLWVEAPRIIRDHSLRPALAGLAAAAVHAWVECGFRIPANAAWAWVLFVCLFATDQATRAREVGPGRGV